MRPGFINAGSKVSIHGRVAFPIVGALLSGVLMATAFPPVGEAQAAWVALVPLLLVVRTCPGRRAFCRGLVAGGTFWLLSVAWLLRLGLTGCPMPAAVGAWLGVALCMTVFLGAFAACAGWCFRVAAAATGPLSALRRLSLLVMVPVLWVGFEYIRSTIATGFPWNALGVSQYRNLPVLQLAEWGGVYAVSAVVAAVNTGLTLMMVRLGGIYLKGRPVRFQVDLMLVLLLLALCWVWGVRRVRQVNAASLAGDRVARIVAVQPNIAQRKKWTEESAYEILLSLEERMDLVRSVGRQADLVIWPETAVPGWLPDDVHTAAFVEELVRQTGVPVLVGAMEACRKAEDGSQKSEGEAYSLNGDGLMGLQWYNSSFLYNGEGKIVGRYRKQHLVPFGEYLPLDEHVDWIRRCAPLGFSCMAGATATVFRVSGPSGAALEAAPGAADPTSDLRPPASGIAFSPLICFEDAFAYLGRRAVRNGARLLVNQTNDAWFDGSSAAVQHVAHCVFRCVENRVPAVRATNTGVTCFIDRTGQIDETTRGILKRKEWDRIDYRSETLRIPADDMPLTFYTRYGDWPFAVPCAAVSAGVLLMLVIRRRGN